MMLRYTSKCGYDTQQFEIVIASAAKQSRALHEENDWIALRRFAPHNDKKTTVRKPLREMKPRRCHTAPTSNTSPS